MPSPEPIDAAPHDILNLRIQHEREVLSFQRSRGESSETQAAATAGVAAAVAAIAANAHPAFNGWLAAAAVALLLASIAAVSARARYPPPLRLVEPDSTIARLERAVAEADAALDQAFAAPAPGGEVRERLASVWGAMAARERLRAKRKNRWLTVSLYALLFELTFGVVGLIVGG
jgi:hypothetical protein